jgi:hypothetical protein
VVAVTPPGTVFTDRDAAIAYAERWAEDWNRCDLTAILAHFDEAVEFTSPKALAAVGVATVHGKTALAEYWRIALSRIESLRFVVQRVIWDPATLELAIVYDREVNGLRDRAAEVLLFAPTGLVVRGEVFYGV